MYSLSCEILLDVLKICSQEVESSRVIVFDRLRNIDDVKMVKMVPE